MTLSNAGSIGRKSGDELEGGRDGWGLFSEGVVGQVYLSTVVWGLVR